MNNKLAVNEISQLPTVDERKANDLNTLAIAIVSEITDNQNIPAAIRVRSVSIRFSQDGSAYASANLTVSRYASRRPARDE